ncbi:DUF2304 domain-containing protein [Flavobacterium sp.]|uniref:DUF2304 domain-containing protein n=1 Tax=Flavobacterium sp. TaxID=239 RepID=UPI003263F543
MDKIQLLVITMSILFGIIIARLIYKNKLREEYAFLWIIADIVLLIFSFWRNGLEIIADYLNVADPPNLLFTAFIFIILVYLLHLSVVKTKMRDDIKKMAQEIAFLKNKLDEKNK